MTSRSTSQYRALSILVMTGLAGACDSGPLEAPLVAAGGVALAVGTDTSMAGLGARLFDDRDLSIRRNQSCSSCHAAEWGFSGPDPAVNAGGSVYPGSLSARFGNRRPPTASYATMSPVLSFDDDEQGWMGGNFWDGRATGRHLGSPSADQAQGPFLNPLEQALADPACVVFRVSRASYRRQYASVFGEGFLRIAFPPETETLCGGEGITVPLSALDRARVTTEYDRIARAIAAFEASPALNQFSSKYDEWLEGRATLTRQERQGLELFETKALCAQCHPTGKRALFTDFTYDNLGVPRNPKNPVYTYNPTFLDLGLGGFLRDPEQDGKVKVPTLRNVDRRPYPGAVKAYMHNGAFKSLEEVVHFYNTRDVLPRCGTLSNPRPGQNCWRAPEVATNVNRDELGNLGLTPAQEAAVVAFMKTLSDGYHK